jgi:hypothetical protein
MTNLLAVFWISKGVGGLAGLLPFGDRAKKAVLAGLLAATVAVSVPSGSFRREFYAHDYGKNLLRTMPPDSSLYEPDDTTAFVLSYMQTVEGRRKDVVPLMTLRTLWGYEQMKRRHPLVVPQRDFKNAQEFIAALLGYQNRIGRPLFTDHSSKFPPGLNNFPVGLLSRAGALSSISGDT